MIKYGNYAIIESEEDFSNNFHLGDGPYWENTSKGYMTIDYYKNGELNKPTIFPCAYYTNPDSILSIWYPCSIEEAKEFWNKVILQRVENLQNLLKKINENY